MSVYKIMINSRIASFALLTMAVIICAAIIVVPVYSQRSEKERLDPHIEHVSIINLIAAPEKYNDKLVRVKGYASAGEETSALYFHKEDNDQFLYENAVWLSLNNSKMRTYRFQNPGYVIVEGIFNSKNKGHLGAFNGGIERIQRLDYTNNK